MSENPTSKEETGQIWLYNKNFAETGVNFSNVIICTYQGAYKGYAKQRYLPADLTFCRSWSTNVLLTVPESTGALHSSANCSRSTASKSQLFRWHSAQSSRTSWELWSFKALGKCLVNIVICMWHKETEKIYIFKSIFLCPVAFECCRDIKC